MPRYAVFLLIASLLAACAITSVDSQPTAEQSPTATSQPTNALIIATATPAPTATPEPPTIALVALIGHFGKAPSGSTAQLAHEGMQLATATNSALYLLEVFDLDKSGSPSGSAAIKLALDSQARIVITVGEALANSTSRAAAQSPDTSFIAVDQMHADALPNLFTIGGPGNRLDQEGFLAGALAGLATQERNVGVVVQGASDDGKRYANGFAHGLRFTCGECKLWRIELDNTTDTEAGAHTATRLANIRADVMFAAAGAAGDAGLLAAAEQGLWVVGAGRDYSLTVPDANNAVLGSVLRRPDHVLPQMVQHLLEGIPPHSSVDFSLQNGTLGMAEHYAQIVSPAMVALMDDYMIQLASGALDTGIDPATGDEK